MEVRQSIVKKVYYFLYLLDVPFFVDIKIIAHLNLNLKIKERKKDIKMQIVETKVREYYRI